MYIKTIILESLVIIVLKENLLYKIFQKNSYCLRVNKKGVLIVETER